MQSAPGPHGGQLLQLAGRLDADTTAGIWRGALAVADQAGSAELVVDASGVEYCDGAGIGLLLALRQRAEAGNGRFTLQGLREQFQQLLEAVEPSPAVAAEEAARRLSFVESVGRTTLGVVASMRALVSFVGELSVWLVRALRNPRTIRFQETMLVAERAGIGAVPIITLIGFLLGMILSFQSAIPMQRFGAEIFVADLLAISMLRELGPLMAAIMLTARSGSAFAAEIGTMRVNEEIDALTTMGVDPTRFLVLPRVLAAMIVVPSLTMLMNLFALIGGWLVMLSLGFPTVTYVNRVIASATVGDLMGGLFKAMVFGIIVAAVGCLRGLQTGSDAGAVGESTTSSVVSGIILISLTDGILAIVFYAAGL